MEHSQRPENLIYDRQIRLWGLDAQEKIFGASILFVGLESPLIHEVIKNLVISGIKNISLFVESEDLCVNSVEPLFFSKKDLGSDVFGVLRNKLHRMQNHLNVKRLTSRDSLTECDVVICCTDNLDTGLVWSDFACKNKKNFCFCNVANIGGWGYFDYINVTCEDYLRFLALLKEKIFLHATTGDGSENICTGSHSIVGGLISQKILDSIMDVKYNLQRASFVYISNTEEIIC